MSFNFSNVIALKNEIIQACLDTIIMVGLSSIASIFVGGLLGILLFVTGDNQIRENKYIHQALSQTVNFMRAFPFVILMVALLGITRMVVGTSFGPIAAAFVLSIAGLFYFSRLVEQNLQEVPGDIIEAAQILGASYPKIIFSILLKESLPGIILSASILIITLLSSSAAGGMIGGGGLGDLAIRYGYQRYQPDVVVFIVILLSIMVVIIQSVGNFLATKLNRK
ncbi:MAG: ABC transporter permease subunit [Neisseriaceae bacterium]|nr:MAG: ABC transporter permease subunit [Neisseriaceae bacterium]